MKVLWDRSIETTQKMEHTSNHPDITVVDRGAWWMFVDFSVPWES